MKALSLTLTVCALFVMTDTATAQQVEELLCTYNSDTGTVDATWVNSEVVDIVEVFEGGVLVQELFGNVESTSLVPPPGASIVEYCFQAGQSGIETCCTVVIPPPPVTGLTCPTFFSDDPTSPIELDVSWTNGADDYSNVDVFLCGELHASVEGTATELRVPVEPGTTALVEVRGRRNSIASLGTRCTRLVQDIPPGPLNLNCELFAGGTAAVTWVNGAPYDEICILVNNENIAELLGDATSFTADGLEEELVTICVQGKLDDLILESCCELEILPTPCPQATIDSVTPGDGGADVQWTLPQGEFDAVEISRDGELVYESTDFTVDSFFDVWPEITLPNVITYHVVTICAEGGAGFSEPVSVINPSSTLDRFVRGDCNNDGFQDIGDLIKLLVHLFLSGPTSQGPPCPDACDFNNDGILELEDVFDQIDFYFRNGPGPDAPYPNCGPDTGTSLGCETYDQCGDLVHWDAPGWRINPELDLADGGERPVASARAADNGVLTDLHPPHNDGTVHGLRRDCAALRSGIVTATGEVVFRPSFGVGALPGLIPINYLEMTYSSKIDFQSCAGNGWNLWPLTERIVVLDDGTIRRFDSRLARFDDYDPVTGQAQGQSDCVDDDCDGVVDDVCFRSPDGTVTSYDAATGLLRGIRDRHGNEVLVVSNIGSSGKDGVSFSAPVITGLTDSHGRSISYEYDDFGRVSTITDFEDRVTTFEYDDSNHLVAVTLPAVTGTPNDDDDIASNGTSGNDFPDGKTMRFRYDTTNPDPNLRDNLLGVTYPNEVASGGPERHVFEYGKIFGDPDFDRCVTVQSGSNSSTSVVEGDPAPPSSLRYHRWTWTYATDNTREARVTDGNGNVTEYEYDDQLRVVRADDLYERRVNPNDVTPTGKIFEWDGSSRLVSMTNALGAIVEYTYDTTNANRSSQFNCLEVRVIPDDARGADQSELVTSYTYDPIYNQLRTVTTPRGNDESYTPPISDPQSLDLVDFNLDGDTDDLGDTVRRSRYTTVYIYDYQEGTAQEISDLAASQGVVGDLDGDGLLDVAAALALDNDENGDGTTSQQAGNRIKVRFPWVRTDSDGAPVVEEIIETHTYNDFGQRTSTADPEGNLTSCYYYPLLTPNEDGPELSNFGGGFLRMMVQDDDPAAASDPSSDGDRPIAQAVENSGTDRRVRPAEFVVVKTHYEYDAVGNRTAVTDGRGVTTTFDVNSHNQTTRMNKAELIDAMASGLTARGYVTEYCYDYNGNTTCVRVEDRGNTSECGSDNGDIPFVDTDLRYDVLDRLVSIETEVVRQELGQVTTTRSVYRYDANHNVVLEIAPEGNATTYIYDDRDLLFRKTVGALGLPPLVQLSSEDPNRFSARGGVPATHTFVWDSVADLIEHSDADDSDGSSANNSSVGGGDRTRYLYDGFSRLVSVVDPAGNQSVCQYDPDGNRVSQSLFGSTGGFTPSSDGPETLDQPVSSNGTIQVGNLVSSTLLSRVESLLDERADRFQGDAVLFHNSTAVTRELDLADGGVDVGKTNPIDGDDDAIPGVDDIEVLGRVNSQTEYDRNGCVISTTDDTGGSWTCQYDGLNRLLVLTDSVGTIKECSYDENSNLVETSTTHTASDGSAPDRVFLRTYVYDSLDRCVQEVDNLGQSNYYRYDSRNNLVCTADPEGPDGADITRVFDGDSETVDQTNDPGNVTLYYYDGLSRMVRSEEILTSTGAGDGTLPCDDDGVKDSTTGPVPDTSQGGGDGIIRSGTVYDGNSNVVASLDDQGNVSIALYDNLDRCIAEAAGLSVNSILTVDRALDNRRVPAPTTKTVQAPLFFPAALLNAQMAALEEQLADLDTLFPQLADRVDAATSQIYGIDCDCDMRLHLDENGSEWHNYYDALHQVLARRCFRAGQNSDDYRTFNLFDTFPVRFSSGGGGSGGAIWLTVGTIAQDFEYDGLGRVTFSGDYLDDDSDGDGLLDGTECSFSYDSLGNCVEESRTLPTGETVVCSSGFRGGSLRSSLTYPNGRVVDYSYDDLNRFTAISETVAGAGASDLATFDYMGPSLLMRRSHGNLVVSNIGSSGKDGVSYDGGGRVTHLEHLDAAGGSMLGFDWGHDRRGLRVSQEKSHDNGNNENWSFDSMGRTTLFERPNAGAQTPLHSTFELDGVGNWLSVDEETREHSNFNELVTQTDGGGTETPSSHDANGNLVVSNIGSSGKDGVRSFEYDALDRLVRVTEDDAVGTTATIAAYVYDAHDRRVVSNIGSSGKDGVSFAWDGSEVVEEHDQDDVLVSQYCWDGSGPPVCYDSYDADGGRTSYYCLPDVTGSCYGLTDADGNLVEAYMYDAHGRQTVITEETGGTVDFGDTTVYTAGGASGLGFPYLFQGMRYDEETNLYHQRGDYCSSSRSRFLTRDGGGSYEMNVNRIDNGSLQGDMDIKPVQTLHRGGDEDRSSVKPHLDVSKNAARLIGMAGPGGGGFGPGAVCGERNYVRSVTPDAVASRMGGLGGGTGSGMGSLLRGWDGTYKGKRLGMNKVDMVDDAELLELCPGGYGVWPTPGYWARVTLPDSMCNLTAVTTLHAEFAGAGSPGSHKILDRGEAGDNVGRRGQMDGMDDRAGARRRRAATVINLQTPLGSQSRGSGTVKFFNETKGFNIERWHLENVRIPEKGLHKKARANSGFGGGGSGLRKNRRPQLFSTAARVGRTGRNPQTGATIQIRANGNGNGNGEFKVVIKAAK